MSEHNNETPSSSKAAYWIAIFFVIGCFAWASIPNFVRDPWTSPTNACINNLRQIDAAAQQFALEHSLTNGDRINFPNDLTNYIKLNSAGKIPSCPSGGTYHIARVGKNPTCSLGTNVTPAHVLQ